MRLIDANALKEALNFVYDCAYIDSKSKEGIVSDIIAEIDNAPTVKTYCYFCGQTEHGQIEDRPQGEWIITGEEQGALGIIYKMRKCNKCGWENSLLIPRNFCPNCGAKMRSGAE